MGSGNRITISWSGGKDSTFALHSLLQSEAYDIVHIHTVIDSDTRRVGLHGVREEMIEAQSRQLGLELVKGYLKASGTGSNYEELVRGMYRTFRAQGVTHIMFGDIFLEDLRSYREELLRESGLIPVYPLWKGDSLKIVRQFVDGGFKTIVCSANETCHRVGMLGKTLDHDLLERLPAGIDPCGENGEFHTFVFDGPVFKSAVPVALGEVVQKTYEYSVVEDGQETRKTSTFYFQDILP